MHTCFPEHSDVNIWYEELSSELSMVLFIAIKELPCKDEYYVNQSICQSVVFSLQIIASSQEPNPYFFTLSLYQRKESSVENCLTLITAFVGNPIQSWLRITLYQKRYNLYK